MSRFAYQRYILLRQTNHVVALILHLEHSEALLRRPQIPPFRTFDLKTIEISSICIDANNVFVLHFFFYYCCMFTDCLPGEEESRDRATTRRLIMMRGGGEFFFIDKPAQRIAMAFWLLFANT